VVGAELLDRVRCFDRVSTPFFISASRSAAPPPPHPSLPSQLRLVLKRETATLADPFLISLPPAFLWLFPSHHVKRLCGFDAFHFRS